MRIIPYKAKTQPTIYKYKKCSHFGVINSQWTHNDAHFFLITLEAKYFDKNKSECSYIYKTRNNLKIKQSYENLTCGTKLREFKVSAFRIQIIQTFIILYCIYKCFPCPNKMLIDHSTCKTFTNICLVLNPQLRSD